jgi:transcriptional regulator with XRE-family HTH domain
MIQNMVKIFRTQQGKSLEQVARAIGVDKSYISKIESGKRCPGPDIMFDLAKYFKCKVDELFNKQEHVFYNKDENRIG